MLEEKKKSWFSRHKILTALICLFIAIGVLAVSTDTGEQTNNDSGLTANSVENKNSISDETTVCTGKTFEQLCINKKINDCTELCAGEDIEIPAVKTDCHSTCYQVYYYGGETDLDDLIKEFKNG